MGADARLTADPGADRRCRRRRPARASARSVRAWTRCAPPASRSRRTTPWRPAGRSSASASACRCCSTAARRTTDAAGLGVIPGTVRWIPAGREAPADAVEPARHRRRRRPDVRRPRRRPWMYFVHSLHGVPDDPARGRRHVRVRRRRSTPRSGAATCSPRSSTPRSRARPGLRAARATSSRRRRVPSVIGPVSRRSTCAAAASCGCRRATTTDETVYGDDPVAVAASFAERRCALDPRRRPRRGPHRRSGQPAGRRRDRGGRRRRARRCRPAAACARRRRRELADAGVARVVMGSAAVERSGARRRRRPTSSPVAVGLDHRDGEVAVHGWTEGERTARSTTRSRWFPTAAAFVITDIGRDGMLVGPDVDGLAPSADARRGAGDRERRRVDARRRGRRWRRIAASAASSPARRSTRAASPSPKRSPPSGRPREAVVKVARVIPCLDVTDGRVVKGINFVDLRDAGDPVELAARYDARRCRRARVPRHHRVERRPRHDGRRGAARRRAGVHPVHGRRRHPHASRTPGGCCAPAPTRSASTPRRSSGPS